MAETGIRVPLRTHAPLSLPGTLSTAGHCDQSMSAICSQRVSVRGLVDPPRRARCAAALWLGLLCACRRRGHVAFQSHVYDEIAVVLVVVCGVKEQHRTASGLRRLGRQELHGTPKVLVRGRIVAPSQ